MLLCVAFAIALAVLLMWVFYLQQQRVQEEALSAQARMVASWLAEPQQWERIRDVGTPLPHLQQVVVTDPAHAPGDAGGAAPATALTEEQDRAITRIWTDIKAG